MIQQIEYRKVSELVLLSNNPRKISKEDMGRLVQSIQTHGFWEHRPIAVSMRTGEAVVICGNQRLKAAKKLKLKEVPCVVYTDIDEEEERDIILRDNINNGEWDLGALQGDDWTDTDFDEIGLKDLQIEDHTQEDDAKHSTDSDGEDKEAFYRSMLTDCLYESNNIYDIPTLRRDMQAGNLILPIAPYGADTRLKKGISTYHFYVEDYRFEAIWKNPTKVLMSGCVALVEPNLSLFDTTPIAFGLQQIYKKRWIARYFQDCGIKVYADLNVSRKFQAYNKLGIPEGYNAFFTRGYADRLSHLEEELEIARQISGLETPNLIVYGGGEKAHEFCALHNLVYVEQYMTEKDGKKRREKHNEKK